MVDTNGVQQRQVLPIVPILGVSSMGRAEAASQITVDTAISANKSTQREPKLADIQ